MILKIELSLEQMKKQEEFKIFTKNIISPLAAKCDFEEKLDNNIIEALASKGYLGAMLPKKFHGMEFDQISIGMINEEIGKVCSSSRSLLTVHGMVALAIYRWGTEVQKKYWLPKMATGEIIGAFGLTEPNVGSDAKGIETTAELSENNYILNGTKVWITMGQIADIFLIFAKCDGKPTAFLVERKTQGVSVEPMKGLLGMRASMTAKITMDKCKIPKENLVGSEGTGLSHVAMTSLDYGRYTIAWGCVGLAEACLQQSLDYCKTRKQFQTHIGEHQLIKKMISEMIVNIKAARLMCLNAGYLREIGAPESIMETWNAKYFASRIANQISSDAVQIHGANGCCNKYDIERYYRDAKINEIIEGTSQIHEILISSYALRSK